MHWRMYIEPQTKLWQKNELILSAGTIEYILPLLQFLGRVIYFVVTDFFMKIEK